MFTFTIDFTTEATLDAKWYYNRYAHNNENILKKIRSNNGYFSDASFLEYTYDSK